MKRGSQGKYGQGRTADRKETLVKAAVDRGGKRVSRVPAGISGVAH